MTILEKLFLVAGVYFVISVLSGWLLGRFFRRTGHFHAIPTSGPNTPADSSGIDGEHAGTDLNAQFRLLALALERGNVAPEVAGTRHVAEPNRANGRGPRQ
jgi:hypothetical protein